MNLAHEPIAPDIIQALVAKATDSGLSMNEYLRRLLGLTGKPIANLASIESVEDATQPEDAKLSTLQRIAEKQANRPFTKSADTVTMLREARAGAMWDEPTEPASTTNGDQQSPVRLELTQDQLWIQANRENYRGEWVVLEDGKLITHGKEELLAVRSALAQGVKSPFIDFIPEEDLPWAGF